MTLQRTCTLLNMIDILCLMEFHKVTKNGRPYDEAAVKQDLSFYHLI